jgi:hypothetical protein
MFDVIAAQIDVRISLSLNSFDCTINTGLRYRGPEPWSSPSNAHQISPRRTTTLPWQGPSLCICEERIDRRVRLVIPIHSVEFLTNTGKSLAVDIYRYGIGVKHATRPAPQFRESISLFEERIRNRDRGLHELSITVVIPSSRRNKPARGGGAEATDHDGGLPGKVGKADNRCAI